MSIKRHLPYLAGLVSTLMFYGSVEAASFPIANMDMIAKRLSDSQTISFKTDDKGAFTIFDANNNTYYLWLQNEEAPPIKVTATNGKISGKLTLTVEDPLPAKKAPAKKPVVKTPVAKPKN